MLPKTVEYALRAIVWLAANPDRREAAGPLSGRTRIPRRYVHKVMQAMVQKGLVDSVSGPGGGYVLRRSAERLSVLDVVNAVAPVERIRGCPLGITEHTQLCPLHRELDRVYAEIEKSFARITISELVRSAKKTTSLCEISR
jgi:Rrf2 family protein